ncbi:MAG: hypothetical protein HQ518_11755 [Rhodopirellula sp.]|nr:hypothetical protein [Rhodopirellula sp.]
MSKETTILMPDDRCEFMKTWGRKGKEFWPKTEIMALTGISEWRWGRLVEKGMKVVLIDGVEVVAEAEFRKFCQRMINTDDKIKIAAKLGRPDTTADIAEFANSRRPIMSWKEIYNEWSDANPDDRRVKNWKHLRDTWSRHYRKKPYQKKAGELF